jgi:hypothetical protein
MFKGGSIAQRTEILDPRSWSEDWKPLSEGEISFRLNQKEEKWYFITYFLPSVNSLKIVSKHIDKKNLSYSCY